MSSKKRSSKGDKPSEEAVLNLTIDGSFPEAEVREVQAPDAEAAAFQTPCTVTGITAGLSGGALGYAFGFGGYWLRNRLKGSWRPSLADGWSSARTFGVMGGLYAAVNCFMLRLRQTQDAWNGAASGCATGLALGWKSGPLSALQSCAMLGAFSFFLDGMAPPAGDDGAAHAAVLVATASESDSFNDRKGRSERRGRKNNETPSHRQQNQLEKNAAKSAIELFLSPAVPLAAALRHFQPCRLEEEEGGDNDGARDGDRHQSGCIVRRRR